MDYFRISSPWRASPERAGNNADGCKTAKKNADKQVPLIKQSQPIPAFGNNGKETEIPGPRLLSENQK